MMDRKIHVLYIHCDMRVIGKAKRDEWTVCANSSQISGVQAKPECSARTGSALSERLRG